MGTRLTHTEPGFRSDELAPGKNSVTVMEAMMQVHCCGSMILRTRQLMLSNWRRQMMSTWCARSAGWGEGSRSQT